MTSKLKIHVNTLNSILEKFFGYDSIAIESVEIASLTSQRNPITHTIGPGGVLTLNVLFVEDTDG